MDLKDLVRRNNQYLVDNLSPEIVTQHLFARNVFTHDEVERINDEPTKAGKSAHLLRTLWRKGTKGFQEFFNALDKTEQSWIRVHVEGSDKDELLRDYHREPRDLCKTCGQAVPKDNLHSVSRASSKASQFTLGKTRVETEADMREQIRLLEMELKNETAKVSILQSRNKALENEKDKQFADMKKTEERHKAEIANMKEMKKHSEDDLTSLKIDYRKLQKIVSDLQQKNEDSEKKLDAYKSNVEAKYQKLIKALEEKSSTPADILSSIAAINIKQPAEATATATSPTPGTKEANVTDPPLCTVAMSGSSSFKSVSCTPMTLDRERVGGDLLVSENGLLLETAERSEQNHMNIGGFSEYKGTCSCLLIPLPPSPSALTTPRYWETHSRIKVGRVLGWGWPLLEMALCQEGEVDTGVWVSDQTRNSWAVRDGDCDRHYPGICTRIYRDGEQVGDCWSNTMSDAPGTNATLKYGIVVDVGKGRLSFLDLNREIVLHSFNVQFTESLRPMFGIWPSPFYTVKMTLVSGDEIKLTDIKRDLICQALSTM